VSIRAENFDAFLRSRRPSAYTWSMPSQKPGREGGRGGEDENVEGREGRRKGEEKTYLCSCGRRSPCL
jgi:hypothetical protein